MKNFVSSIITFFVALIGFTGGMIWALRSDWEPEPIILMAISAIEMVGFAFMRNLESPQSGGNTYITVQGEMGTNDKRAVEEDEKQKGQTRILFIDDNHTDFKMVSILKKSGWINTKSVKDVTDLDDPKVLEADVIFVDINGVGTTMFQDQGLGLASALKKKYHKKKIVLYSSETTGNRFHNALREVDSCLSKNAEPYQFVSLIESFTKN